MIVVIILLVVETCVCLFLVFYVYDAFRCLAHKKAPFVPVPRAVLKSIVDQCVLDSTSVVYDLGCGDGRVLAALYARYPGAEYVGIEYGVVPFLISYIRFIAGPVRVRYKDFFMVDCSQATHMFMYLYPHVVDALLPKLENELHAGTTVILCDFPFSHKIPTRVVDISHHHPLLGKKLFVYTF